MNTNIKSIDQYQVLGLAGEGGQANVYLAVKNFKLYAIKVFNASMYKGEAFKRETKFLALFQKHPNLIEMWEKNGDALLRYEDGLELKRSIIVLEFVERGDLYEYIKIGKGFQPHIVRALFFSILEGIEHLHSMGVAHRDLKPENILFNQDFQVKLSDFGLSTFSEGTDRNFVLTTRVGTEGFKAPEVDSGEYNGEKADIFAIGVILFVMFVGSPPFMTTKSTDKVYKLIINKNFDRFWSIHEKNKPKNFFPACFKTLINSLLCSNPENRPTLSQIRDFEWLKLEIAEAGVIKKQLESRFEKILTEFADRQKITHLVEKHKKSFPKSESKNQQEETNITSNPQDFLSQPTTQQEPIKQVKEVDEL